MRDPGSECNPTFLVAILIQNRYVSANGMVAKDLLTTKTRIIPDSFGWSEHVLNLSKTEDDTLDFRYL